MSFRETSIRFALDISYMQVAESYPKSSDVSHDSLQENCDKSLASSSPKTMEANLNSCSNECHKQDGKYFWFF
ncbi:hypothetical protein HN873_058415 [Arachis hypogaea]